MSDWLKWFKKDPEIEKIMDRLSKQLEISDNWEVCRHEIRHKEYNIRIDENWIIDPDKIRIPRHWKKTLHQRTSIIFRNQKLAELNFIFNVIDGKYCYYVDITLKDQRGWLEENAKEGEIFKQSTIMRGYGTYFIDPELAMAFKLVFT